MQMRFGRTTQHSAPLVAPASRQPAAASHGIKSRLSPAPLTAEGG
jgi:hypothetical protein